jgi:hypothetical protein
MTNLQDFHLPFSNTSTLAIMAAFLGRLVAIETNQPGPGGSSTFEEDSRQAFFYDTNTANPWPALGHAYAKLTALFDQVCEYRTNQTEGPGSPKVFSKQGFGGFEVRHKKRDTFTVFFCDPFKDPAPPSSFTPVI